MAAAAGRRAPLGEPAVRPSTTARRTAPPALAPRGGLSRGVGRVPSRVGRLLPGRPQCPGDGARPSPAGTRPSPGARRRRSPPPAAATEAASAPAPALDQPRHALHARSPGAQPPMWTAHAPLGGSRRPSPAHPALRSGSDQPRSARHQVRRSPGRRPFGPRSARQRLVTGPRRPAQGPPAPAPATPVSSPAGDLSARTLCRAGACRGFGFLNCMSRKVATLTKRLPGCVPSLVPLVSDNVYDIHLQHSFSPVRCSAPPNYHPVGSPA